MANSPSQNPRGRILLVDDNSLGLAARRSVLEELGHKVQTSGTPAEALDLCGKQRFDVVVTDYKMPKMDGVEFIGRLRKLHPTAVILIS
jgi:CheY-like chemotaxis protein